MPAPTRQHSHISPALRLIDAPVKDRGARAGRHHIDVKLKAMGHNREWLAKQAGISPSTLGNYIHGRAIWHPERRATRNVCRVLNCDLNFLITGRNF